MRDRHHEGDGNELSMNTYRGAVLTDDVLLFTIGHLDTILYCIRNSAVVERIRVTSVLHQISTL